MKQSTRAVEPTTPRRNGIPATSRKNKKARSNWKMSDFCVAGRGQGPRQHQHQSRVESSISTSPNELDTHFKHRQINMPQNCDREKTTHQTIPCLTSAAMPYDTFRCGLITGFEALIFQGIHVHLMTATSAQPVLHGPQRIPFPFGTTSFTDRTSTTNRALRAVTQVTMRQNAGFSVITPLGSSSSSSSPPWWKGGFADSDDPNGVFDRGSSSLSASAQKHRNSCRSLWTIPCPPQSFSA